MIKDSGASGCLHAFSPKDGLCTGLGTNLSPVGPGYDFEVKCKTLNAARSQAGGGTGV